LIVSDVPEGEERIVASGPTVTAPNEAPDPGEVIARYNIPLPVAFVDSYGNRECSAVELDVSCDARTSRLLSNSDALQAAATVARQRGFIAEIVSDISDQPIEEGCDLLLRRLEMQRAKHRGSDDVVCLISGGEFACPVQGSGIGGRNLESALRLTRSQKHELVKYRGTLRGTDGIDGNSPLPAQSLIARPSTAPQRLGSTSKTFLRRSDSYSFFVALGDVIATGPTGTNVCDLRINLEEMNAC